MQRATPARWEPQSPHNLGLRFGDVSLNRPSQWLLEQLPRHSLGHAHTMQAPSRVPASLEVMVGFHASNLKTPPPLQTVPCFFLLRPNSRNPSTPSAQHSARAFPTLLPRKGACRS